MFKTLTRMRGSNVILLEFFISWSTGTAYRVRSVHILSDNREGWPIVHVDFLTKVKSRGVNDDGTNA